MDPKKEFEDMRHQHMHKHLEGLSQCKPDHPPHRKKKFESQIMTTYMGNMSRLEDPTPYPNLEPQE